MDPINWRKVKCIFMTCFFWAGLTSYAYGHAGHKHEAGDPSITLPAMVAQVNGVDIPDSKVLPRLRQALKGHASQGHQLTIAQEKAEAKKLIEDEINRELMLQKAKSLGIEVTPEMLENKIAAVKKRFRSEAQFEKRLASMNMTLEQYKEELKPELLLDAVISREVKPQIKIDADEVKAYYEQNKKPFWEDDQRSARVILIKIDLTQGPGAEQLAREKMEAIYKKAKDGADFAELAKKHSQDSLAKKGGDLGFFTKKRMLKDFSERAFQMDVGSISDIFQTKHGFHILKVTGKKAAGYKPLESVKDKIEAELEKRKVADMTKAFVQTLKQQADVKVYF